MLKGYWLCLKRFPKPELVIFACVAVLVITLGKAVDNYVTDKAVQVYEKTHSMSNESLEIVLCPMPRVYGLRLTHFGESLSKFFNKLLFDGIVRPFMTNLEAKLRKEHPLMFIGNLKKGCLKCLDKYKEYRATDNLASLISVMANYGRCQVKPIVFMPLFKALEDGTLIKRFLDNYFGTLDEMLLEEYPNLLDQSWVLRYENLTMKQMLDYVGVNLKRYIDESVLRKSVQDIAGPSQILKESVIDTRMASNCFRHVFRHSENHGYHRSKIIYQFRKSCPKEPEKTLVGKSPCLETADMYITMYITAYNQFTDVPAASVIVPYRVAADENALVHVSAVKRLHKKDCKTYGLNESQVTCIEDCLYEKMTSDNYTQHRDSSEYKMLCSVPWIDRLKKRSNSKVNLTICHSQKDLKSTIEMISSMFDIAEASDCSQRCPRHCEQLTITPRLTGSAHTPQNSSARIPRHPRLEVLISDTLPVFSETQQYDFGKMIAEMLGNLSFLVGVSLVALYDWLIGVVLWMFGKLPFIPSMPPLIKNEIYMKEICSCAETDEERRQSIRDTMDESETYLAASFKHHRRASVLRSFNPHDERGTQRRRAMTLNNFPAIAIRSSAIDTVASTFPSEQKSDVREQSRHSSVDKRQSRAEDGDSPQALSGEESDARLPLEGAPIPVRSHSSVQPSLTETPKPVLQSATAGRKQRSAAAVSETRPSREALKKSSSRRVAPAEAAAAAEEAEEPQRSHGLPSIAAAKPVSQGLPDISAPGPARPKAAVTFDLDDVERILGPSASSQQQLSDDLGQPAEEQTHPERWQEQTGRDKAVSQYRSRPLRKWGTKARHDHQPDG